VHFAVPVLCYHLSPLGGVRLHLRFSPPFTGAGHDGNLCISSTYGFRILTVFFSKFRIQVAVSDVKWKLIITVSEFKRLQIHNGYVQRPSPSGQKRPFGCNSSVMYDNNGRGRWQKPTVLPARIPVWESSTYKLKLARHNIISVPLLDLDRSSRRDQTWNNATGALRACDGNSPMKKKLTREAYHSCESSYNSSLLLHSIHFTWRTTE
jgi:hypothetical protein